MSEPLRPARIDWTQDGPFAQEFGDIYFSRDGACDETRHVFLNQNDLPRRFATVDADQGFTIIETGFGTGLNFLATLSLWRESGGHGWLHFVSVEGFPLAVPDLIKAHGYWPQFAEESGRLREAYPRLLPGFHRILFAEWRATLTLFLGDISDFITRMPASADAWFLDGFAPGRNPAMWPAELYTVMASHSRPGSTFATFTVAGKVRRGLATAGFTVEKAPGFGAKREMLRGALAAPSPLPSENRADAGCLPPSKATPWLQRPRKRFAERRACVIGAGIAGASTANSLAMRGWSVTVLEQARPASGGSGNPAAVVYPRLRPGSDGIDHFPQQAWVHAVREFDRLRSSATPWHRCGILQLMTGNQATSARRTAGTTWPDGLVEHVDAAAASEHAGIELRHEALWFADGGWLDPGAYCSHLLNAPGITTHCGARAIRLETTATGWKVYGREEELLFEGPVVIAANATAAIELEQLEQLPLQPVRGQVSLAPASAISKTLSTVICHDGYITPALLDGWHCIGATFSPDDSDTAPRIRDQEENLRLLREALPDLAHSLESAETWQARASIRCQSPDYLPLVGPVADYRKFMQCYEGMRHGKIAAYPDLPALPGLYVNLAHGSKGFGQAGLAAEILAAELNDEPYPVSPRVLDSLHPMRFWIRQLKRQK
jgi:tRNA 5-methylaminomethyl-2-thiouridine biosynthesis bifunctional protein